MSDNLRDRIDCPYGQCEHSFSAHECGLCQVVLDFNNGSPQHCPCKYNEDDDE